MRTTKIVTLQHLGPEADADNLTMFVAGFNDACDLDEGVVDYDAKIIGDRAHLTVEGTATAAEVFDHVYETYIW
jgi:hypothetical protein